MVMELDITWAGPPIDDLQLLSKLPDDLTKLLKSVNGFIQFGGALHVRGACQNLEWHSLRHAWESTDAFHRHYRTVKRSDVPFAQSALGDQYFIRDNEVYRLDTECDEIESLDMDFKTFLEEVQSEPIGALNLEPLEEFWDHGGALEPGHLLSVMPPFVLAQPDTKYSYRAISALDRLRFLADFAKQIRDLPDGATISFKLEE
jgi:hypothetical protein